MQKKMELITNSLKKKVNYSCVRCGYCCKQIPCHYGEIITGEKYCRFLLTDDPNIPTYKCQIYNQIKWSERNYIFPMFDCGCSSSLFNTTREAVLKKVKKC